MSQSPNIARQTLKASVVLLGGDLIWALLSACIFLIVAKLLGPAGYGAYTVALALPNTFQLVVGFGLSVSISRYAAFHVARGEFEIALRTTKNGILALIGVAGIIAIVNFFAAPFLATYVLQRSELASVVQLGSIFVIGQAILLSSISACVGWGYNTLASASQIMEAVLELILSPLLILLGFSVLGGVLGHSVSYFFAGLISVLIFGVVVSKRVPGAMGGFRLFVHDFKEMVSFGFLQYLGGLFSTFSQRYFLIIVLSAAVTNALIAYYQAAFNLTAVLSLISTALTLSLLPAFTRLYTWSHDIQLAFRYATTYVSYFTTPFVFFVLGASNGIIAVLYGAQYAPAANLLKILATASLPTTLGMAVLPPFFNAIAKTRLTLVTYLGNALPLFLLAPIVVVYLQMGVVGAIFCLLISNFAGLATGLILAKKYANANYSYSKNLRIVLACTVGLLPIIFMPSEFSSIVTVLIDAFLFFIVYLTLAPPLGIVDRSDLARLSEWSADLGFLSKLLNLLVKYETKLTRKPNSALTNVAPGD